MEGKEKDKKKSKEDSKAAQNLIKVSEACETLVKYCNDTPEPFSDTGNDATNLWKHSPNPNGPCCLLS
ncbi:hypothetical protein QOT17_005282 [Balamuthia mandrillaris]